MDGCSAIQNFTSTPDGLGAPAAAVAVSAAAEAPPLACVSAWNSCSISGAATAEASALGVEPRLAEQLLRKLAPMAEAMLRQGKTPVLLCAGPIRRVLLRLTQRSIPQLAVLSVDEVPLRVSLQSFDVVKVDG